jgi:hypothetical protein
MIIKKTIRFPLDVKNPLAVYSDADNNLISVISSILVGKCYDQCLILTVDAIERRGECTISRSTEPKFGTVPIVVAVTAVTISYGEIINGLVVKHVDNDPNGILLASNEYVSCIMQLTPALLSITAGQIISCRVMQYSYEIGKDKIACTALPMLQKHTAEIYKITKSDIDAGVLSNWLDRCKREEDLITELKIANATAVEKFSKLLLSYKDHKPPKDVKNLFELLSSDFKTLYLSRDPSIDLTTPGVLVVDKPGDVCSVKSTAGVVALLSDYHDMIKCVREMVGIYNTNELLTEHENLWRMFNKNKL